MQQTTLVHQLYFMAILPSRPLTQSNRYKSSNKVMIFEMQNMETGIYEASFVKMILHIEIDFIHFFHH